MFFGGDPFEHFAHMGGGGGGGGRSRAPRGPVDNEGFYKELGVDKSASESEIKKAYRKLAVKHHPDKGGDVEKFKAISAAYEVLSDPEKKKLYDQYGKEGLEEGGGGGGGAEDLFSSFFGGGRGSRGPSKGEDMKKEIKVSLEDLYKSKSVKLSTPVNRLCRDCKGLGGKENAEKTCTTCDGAGVQVMLRQIGPGMMSQQQIRCTACRGAGKFFDERDKCKACGGKKIKQEKEILDVFIDRGMKHGEKLYFRGKANEAPDTIAGDIILVINEQKHETFKRKGADLVITLNISLAEALCGLTRTIRHLDGRVLRIDSPPGNVIKPESYKIIINEGMPHYGEHFKKGRLFVHFRVQFPTKLTAPIISQLEAALPKAKKIELTGDEEEVEMQEVDISQFGQDKGGSAANEEDEDDGAGGARSVQCQQS